MLITISINGECAVFNFGLLLLGVNISYSKPYNTLLKHIVNIELLFIPSTKSDSVPEIFRETNVRYKHRQEIMFCPLIARCWCGTRDTNKYYLCRL